MSVIACLTPQQVIDGADGEGISVGAHAANYRIGHPRHDRMAVQFVPCMDVRQVQFNQRTLLIFNQPFGINALVGLIALSGILMRNTLILIGQIHHNTLEGLDPFHAVVEATVQRARPVLLTAMAAILAFIPLTHSVFWGTLAYTLIGGTFVGTIMTLVFLPAMYSIWFKIRPEHQAQTETVKLA